MDLDCSPFVRLKHHLHFTNFNHCSQPTHPRTIIFSCFGNLFCITKVCSERILFILQKVGVWMAALNNTANPFMYCLFMPIYRKCLMKTFCFWIPRTIKEESVSDSSRADDTSIQTIGSTNIKVI